MNDRMITTNNKLIHLFIYFVLRGTTTHKLSKRKIEQHQDRRSVVRRFVKQEEHLSMLFFFFC